MFGGLHIEIAAWKTIGDWLESSGWTSALVQLNITTAGKADLFLHASHVSRTRYAHEVTACSLYILQQRAYDQYVQSVLSWSNPRNKEYPQFQHWSITLSFELTILMFVMSIREGAFKLYLEINKQLAPWLLALDFINYARWLPVYIMDLSKSQNNKSKCLPSI